MKRQEILLELSLVNQKLATILQAIEDENTGDKQFDYVTSSSLSEIVDRVERKIKNIEEIVYQRRN